MAAYPGGQGRVDLAVEVDGDEQMIEDMEAARWEGVVGALLYPGRPASAETLAVIETIAGAHAVQVTWYDDVDWHL